MDCCCDTSHWFGSMMAQIDMDSGCRSISGDQIRQIPSRAIVKSTLIGSSNDLIIFHMKVISLAYITFFMCGGNCNSESTDVRHIR